MTIPDTIIIDGVTHKVRLRQQVYALRIVYAIKYKHPLPVIQTGNGIKIIEAVAKETLMDLGL